MRNLYKFKNFSERLNGAPRLEPVGGVRYDLTNSKNYLASDSPGYSMIDVINEFQWTTTPKVGRQEVPLVYLKEKRLVTNALIAQAIYYGFALAGVAGGAVAGFNALPNNVRTAALGIAGAFAGKAVSGVIAKLVEPFRPGITNAITTGGVLAGGFGGMALPVDFPSQALGFADDVLKNIQNILPIPERFNIESLGSNVLKPYEGLYITEDTKFVYSLPYFSNTQNMITNQFDSVDEAFTGINPTGLQNLTESMRTLAMGASVAVNLAAPGIYVEKPKFYQFGDKSETVEFSFPLINTGWSTFEDLVRNWQLLFLLAYQNRPNRRSRDLIDPPVIYELTIPGVKYSPFAYIRSLEVQFKGSRRRMNIPVPYTGGTTTVNTIIPDAYVVNVRMETLVGETQNFLYSMIADKQNVVTVTDSYNPFDYARRVMNSSYNQVAANSQNPSNVAFNQGIGNLVSQGAGAINDLPKKALNSIGNWLNGGSP